MRACQFHQCADLASRRHTVEMVEELATPRRRGNNTPIPHAIELGAQPIYVLPIESPAHRRLPEIARRLRPHWRFAASGLIGRGAGCVRIDVDSGKDRTCAASFGNAATRLRRSQARTTGSGKEVAERDAPARHRVAEIAASKAAASPWSSGGRVTWPCRAGGGLDDRPASRNPDAGMAAGRSLGCTTFSS